jgi:hypothetical protein
VLGIAVITLNGKAVEGNAFAKKVTFAIQLVSLSISNLEDPLTMNRAPPYFPSCLQPSVAEA